MILGSKGIHSGPISGVVDVNERTNVAGAGINLAQRVMDCGDAGHILLSRRVLACSRLKLRNLRRCRSGDSPAALARLGCIGLVRALVSAGPKCFASAAKAIGKHPGGHRHPK